MEAVSGVKKANWGWRCFLVEGTARIGYSTKARVE
jgi:hypothetical protein